MNYDLIAWEEACTPLSLSTHTEIWLR